MPNESGRQRVFDTDKRIRLGIWGLGRGMSFFNTCKFLNIDVVAGCDYNAHMRKGFLDANPGAFVTADEDEFLSQDFDAVLLATYALGHGPHAIKCMQAGKHVLSEVISFATMAEGVKLVEEVKKRKLVYQLAENYPFSAPNMWLANRWKEGLFGELMYGEYEYVHECLSLAYTYIDGIPVMPGHTVHNWRSWFNYHYYCTHSLGPVMVITSTRPVAVETFPCKPRLAGYLRRQGASNGTMTPSLIQMDNGAVVRNLMGATTNDSHNQRMWGTRGAYTIGHDGVKLRLGGAGGAPMMNVDTKWEGLGELATKTGHGGGDFWTLYYFAREILTGETGPFDIYRGSDVTIPGIQALRSSMEDGKPMEVPDFRKKADRDRYRDDDWLQESYNVKRGVFGGANLNAKAKTFSTTMKAMTQYTPMVRAYLDWKKVQASLTNPAEFLPIATRLRDNYEKLVVTFKDARAIAKTYPKSDGAQVLTELLEVGEAKTVLAAAFLPALKKDVAVLKRKYSDGMKPLTAVKYSDLLPAHRSISSAEYPDKEIAFSAIKRNPNKTFYDIRTRYAEGSKHEGLVYAQGYVTAKKAGNGTLRIAADGPFKVFLQEKEIGCDPKATNPVDADHLVLPVTWKKGRNEVVIAMRTNNGGAWGFMASASTKQEQTTEGKH